MYLRNCKVLPTKVVGNGPTWSTCLAQPPRKKFLPKNFMLPPKNQFSNEKFFTSV